jgi:hypothetical protein
MWPQGVHTSSLSYAVAIAIEVPASRISALQHFHHQQTIAGRANFGPTELVVECNCIRRRIDFQTSDPLPDGCNFEHGLHGSPQSPPLAIRHDGNQAHRAVPLAFDIEANGADRMPPLKKKERNNSLAVFVRAHLIVGVPFYMSMQVSFLSPPFGPGAFYLKSGAPPGITLGIIFRALVPFIMLQILAVALLVAFPGITGR